MSFTDAVATALGALVTNRLRSALTMLGVVIGVAAVIALVAVGNGARVQIEDRMLSLGANLVTVTPQATSSQGLAGAGAAAQSLTLADMSALADWLGPVAVAIEAEQSAGRWQITAGTTNWNAAVTGVTAGYPIVRDWPVWDGSFFSDADVTSGAQVAVIGATTAGSLFGEASPVGRSIQLRQQVTVQSGITARIVSFRVVGVLQAKGSTAGFARDDQVLVPTTTAQRVLTGRTSSVNTIIVKTVSSATMVAATSDVRDFLLQRHKISDPANADFLVQNQNDVLAAASSSSATLTLLLGAIGGIALLVGGIGIMNIMLVSVQERTREIGIRKAVGAQDENLLAQFLIEAVVLTSLGGALGIGLGWAVADLVRLLDLALVPVVDVTSIVIAAGVSVAIGVVFGLYPAARAARLQPIDALHSV